MSDTKEEGEEEFRLILRSPAEGTSLGRVSMTITIVDDDHPSEDSEERAGTEQLSEVEDVSHDAEQAADDSSAEETPPVFATLR